MSSSSSSQDEGSQTDMTPSEVRRTTFALTLETVGSALCALRLDSGSLTHTFQSFMSVLFGQTDALKARIAELESELIESGFALNPDVIQLVVAIRTAQHRYSLAAVQDAEPLIVEAAMYIQRALSGCAPTMLEACPDAADDLAYADPWHLQSTVVFASPVAEGALVQEEEGRTLRSSRGEEEEKEAEDGLLNKLLSGEDEDEEVEESLPPAVGADDDDDDMPEVAASTTTKARTSSSKKSKANAHSSRPLQVAHDEARAFEVPALWFTTRHLRGLLLTTHTRTHTRLSCVPPELHCQGRLGQGARAVPQPSACARLLRAHPPHRPAPGHGSLHAACQQRHVHGLHPGAGHAVQH